MNKSIAARAARAALRGNFNQMVRGVGGWGRSRRGYIHPGWKVTVRKDGVLVLFVFSVLLPYSLQNPDGKALVCKKMLDALDKYRPILESAGLKVETSEFDDGRPYLRIIGFNNPEQAQS